MGSMDTPRDYATRALVVHKAGDPFTMADITLDEVRDDELLIEMKYSGICHTDIVLASGALPLIDFPAIFGHEGAGTILAIGAGVQDKSLQVGDAVLLSFNTCGACYQCRLGSPAYCHLHPQVNHNAVRLSDRSTPARLADSTPVRSQYFGHSSFAAHSIVKERCVVKLPPAVVRDMPYYAALGCGFQTGAGTVLNVLQPKPDDSLVVFGLGGVGLTAVMAARSLGVKKIVGVDIQPAKLALAGEFGVTDAVDAGKNGDVVARVREICASEERGVGATFSIDCTGVPRVIEQCIEVLAPCGTAATVGVPPPGEKGQIKIDALTFLLENKRYIGVIEGMSTPKQFIPKLVEMHQAGAFPVEKLCKVYGVDDYKKALHDLEEGKVIKPVIQWK